MTPAPMIEPNSSRAPSGAGAAGGDRHHRSDCGEGDAHHDRHLHAEPLRRAERLDDGDDAAAEKVCRNQECDLLRIKVQRAADDERHGDGAGIHHKHMLHSKGGQPGCRQHLVHWMDC